LPAPWPAPRSQEGPILAMDFLSSPPVLPTSRPTPALERWSYLWWCFCLKTQKLLTNI
jgi:hypothetical protein